MARIDHIKHRLERWGAWIEQRDSGGTGYPKQSSFLRLPGPIGGNAMTMTANDLECSQTHDAVKSLRERRPELYKTIEYVYRKNMAYKAVASAIGKNESTVRLYLDQADFAIDVWLREKSGRPTPIEKTLTP
ncbi:MAG: antiterminator Q family protein [Pseudomonadota bacterium]